MVTWQQLAQLPAFPEFYRLIHRLFGVDMAIVAPDGSGGRVLGAGRALNPFCRAIARLPGGRPRCAACDAAHARQVARNRLALRYTCHAGLVEFMIPIVVDGEVVAHLQCGQLLNRQPGPAAWRQARRRLAWATGGVAALAPAFRRSRVLAPATQRDLMALLQLFAHHAAAAHARLLQLAQPPPDRAVARALAFLDQHFRDDLALGRVAAAAGTSTRNLVRLFRLRTGATVLDHLHRRRIAYACRQLRETSCSISQAGLDCGFGSIQQFNRVFRRLQRATPRQWRRLGLAGAASPTS